MIEDDSEQAEAGISNNDAEILPSEGESSNHLNVKSQLENTLQ